MKIHDLPDGRHSFICPGCKDTHTVSGNWAFNGNYNKPTFSPSILIKSGHYASHYKEGDPCWCTFTQEFPDNEFRCRICHSFVTDGQIQYLSDCTHELAGQTVEIPDWDDD